MLLGVVVFGIAASQAASEYSLGTLRQLLVRQPRRLVLLAGKFLGVVTFLLAALLFASVVAFGAAVVAAHARHVSTSAWFTATCLENIIVRIVPGTVNWLPGASLETIASGGTSITSYGHGLIVAAVYLIPPVTATAVTFTRSDITA